MLSLLSLVKDSFITFHHFGAHNIFSVAMLSLNAVLR